jgi:lipopolysaccharide export system permease protein
MRRLTGMLMRQFVPIFLVSILFFILLLQLIDIFPNITRYFSHDVPMREVAWIALLYVPKCISFALPVSFLFSVSFTLGIFYANNELFAIFGSGVSLHRFVLPFIALGLLLSAGAFFFEDAVVIPTFKLKNDRFNLAVKQITSLSQQRVTVTSPDQRVVYTADYYNDAQARLTGLTVVVRDETMDLVERIDAVSADWQGTRWMLRNCRIFTWDAATGILSDTSHDTWESPLLSEPPETFRRLAQSVDQKTRADAERYIGLLRRAGLTEFYREALTDYYRKFSFAATCLIVALIASALGSTFRKNILLMSLLSALVIAVGFYVAQMVTAILAKNAVIQPFMGAWGPFALFLVLGFMLFRTART